MQICNKSFSESGVNNKFSFEIDNVFDWKLYILDKEEILKKRTNKPLNNYMKLKNHNHLNSHYQSKHCKNEHHQ